MHSNQFAISACLCDSHSHRSPMELLLFESNFIKLPGEKITKRAVNTLCSMKKKRKTCVCHLQIRHVDLIAILIASDDSQMRWPTVANGFADWFQFTFVWIQTSIGLKPFCQPLT